ncbi:monofunctional biosynthetic peptidoglycan transglycosylase [Pseudoponticoccus marisrubri]|uniref:Biosynthetic peptidoglycan transglycosylase n=1 Tax=Pseudoponticoccus marisrubri TaxID=1685382 RepID=A0A0W7WIP5_9RHOB|nr:monofunctional biosynthetic peptidoglycan transglycosylase [Pseudoponticoccus marisrubri]KUF10476.1 monofunctional biosynthetic peptidoglycan transglycosylase [Pseudoponticoccus marisrubri]
MATKTASKSRRKPAGKSRAARPSPRRFRPGRWLLRQGLRLALVAGMLMLSAVLLFKLVDPPTTHTIWSEERRLGAVAQDWVAVEDVAPVMLRAVVAAEDANFCTHWGFDMDAIRAAIEEGAARGGSTISQQVVKNVYLWQARSYVRKALEALITPAVEAVWSKRRILEVYLNVAEFDEGVFGVKAAARHHFGTSPEALSPRQAALLAAVLPSPKRRSASQPSSFVQRRARAIMDGAATIAADGRADCFQ